jgi:hypothetical protein
MQKHYFLTDLSASFYSIHPRSAAEATYKGPVPLVTHLHGSENVGDESDGYAEAWYLSSSCKDGAFDSYAQVGTQVRVNLISTLSSNPLNYGIPTAKWVSMPYVAYMSTPTIQPYVPQTAEY